MSMTILLLCIKVFTVRIFDVSLGTLRAIVTIKGSAKLAALIGFFEITIWFLVVREALNTPETSIFIAFAYAGGFAIGTLVGSFLSNKFINGKLTLQIITSDNNEEIVTSIRKAGYAVTVLDVKGRDDVKKNMLYMEINKKRLSHLKKLIKDLDEKAFIVVNETKIVVNGYFK